MLRQTLCLLPCLIYLVQCRVHSSLSDDVVISSDEAGSFLQLNKRWWYPTLEEECYHEEICDWEEVEEAKGDNKQAWEYYYAVLCNRKGTHCKQCTTRASCAVENWSQWSLYGSKNGQQCYQQTRFRAFQHSTMVVNRAYNCDGVLKCGTEPNEQRTWCDCAETVCTQGTWTEWVGEIPSESCGTQTRTRSHIKTTRITGQANNCDGIRTSCPATETETRKMCNCRYQEDCTVKEWGSWSQEVPDFGCGIQLRKREYNDTAVNVVAESCDDYVPCPVILEESRPMCNCRYPACGWDEWRVVSVNKERGCTTFERVMNKTIGLANATQSSCDDLPTTCDTQDAEREEKTECDDGSRNIVTEPPPPTTLPPPTDPPRVFRKKYIGLGCYKDRSISPRVLPINYHNERGNIDWKNMTKTIEKCAQQALMARYEYFAVQYYGECWSGPSAGEDYHKLGLAVETKCWNGVGGRWTNYVYKFVEFPECSEELEFKVGQSSGEVQRGTWCAGRTDEYQWMQATFDKAVQISGIATQGDRKDSHWVTVYTMEYSQDGDEWQPFQEDGEQKLFSGNTHSHTLEITWLNRNIQARFVRLRPRAWNTNNICMTVRLFGCAA